MKNKKLKNLITLCLTAGMLISSLSACGKQEENVPVAEQESTKNEESSKVEEPQSEAEETNDIEFPLEKKLTFTGMNVMNLNYPLSDTIAWKTALERANIEIELTEVQKAELAEKTNLTIAGGTYPDMFIKNTVGANDQNGLDGILIPLEDLIKEYAPNLSSLLDELDAWDDIEAPDGHIYSLPCLTGRSTYFGPYWINKRWMDNLGLNEPSSLEELYNVLKAFKDEDANGNGDPNDEIPITFATNSVTPEGFLQFMPDGLMYPDIYCSILDDSGEFVFYPFTDGYKDNYLGYLEKLYQEGIMDQNAFTQNLDQMSVNGKAADIHGMFRRAQPIGQTAAEYANDYITVKPLDAEHKHMAMKSGILKGGMAITDKCKNPEVLIAWADYFYTEEGAILADLGVEGISYKVYEDGSYSLLDKENAKNPYVIQGTENAPMLFPDFRYKVNAEEDPLNAHAYNETNFSLYKMGTLVPTLAYTVEETSRIAELWPTIKEYLATYTAQVVTGQLELEDSWNDFQSTLKAMGAEELQNIRKAAYDRAVSK